MKPDHEAAKKWAESLGPENTFGVCGPDMLNLARAYLDLLAQLEQLKADKGRAEELLRKVEPELWGTRWNLGEEIRAFLVERGEG